MLDRLLNNVTGCTERSHCFNPLVVATAFDNNASVVVTFTNPLPSYAYETYDVCLKKGWMVSYRQNVKLEVSVILWNTNKKSYHLAK